MEKFSRYRLRGCGLGSMSRFFGRGFWVVAAGVLLSGWWFAPGFAASVPTFRGDEIIVTAARYPQLRSTSPYTASVISKKDLVAMEAQNLGEALQYCLGVDFKNTGLWGATSSLKLRGSGYEQVLVLINGRRTNSPLLGGAAPENILIGNVEKIEVVRFPASSVYGSDAMGGVVNVITEKPTRDLHLNALFSDYNSQQYLLDGGLDWASFVVESVHTDGYRTNGDYNAQNYSAGLDFDFLKLDAGQYFGDRGVPGSTVYPTTTTRQSDRNSFVNLALGGLRTFYEEKLERYNSDPSTTADSLYNSWSTGVEWLQTIEMAKNRKLTYGYEFREDRANSDGVGNRLVDNQAIFLEDQIDWDKWKFEWGLRGDHQSAIGDNLSPRAGAVYSLMPDTQLKLSFGQAYRAPTLNELYWYYADPTYGIITTGNPNLLPERSTSIDLGLARQVDAQTRVSLNYYWSQTQNLIKWVDISGSWLTWEAQNIAASRAEGVEFEFVRHFGADALAFMNYTYQSAINTTTGKKLVYSPENKLNVGVRTENKEGSGSALYVRYVGERFDDESNTNLVPSYTTIDLKLWQKVGEATVSVSADNLANTQYQDTLNYPMPGRRYSVGVRL